MSSVDAILYLLGNLFQVYLEFRLFRLIFKKSIVGKPVLAMGFGCYFIVNSVAFLMFDQPFLNLFTSLLLTLLLTLLYQATWIRRIMAVVLIYAVSFLCEEIVYRVMMAYYGLRHIAALSIITDLLMLPLVLLFEKRLHLQAGDEVPFGYTIPIFWVPSVSIFLAVVVLNTRESNLMIAVGMAGILLINLLIFHLLDHISQAYRQKYEVDLQQQQNKAYENQLQIYREGQQRVTSMKHDMKNHLIVLQSMADKKEYDKLEAYLNNMAATLAVPKQFVNTGNLVFDSILNQKLLSAKEMGVTPFVNLPILADLQVDPLDLSVILGNLLDNALQALSLCQEKYLSVSAALDIGILGITVVNSYSGILKDRNGKLLSTKKDQGNHGIGLKNVESAVQRYAGSLDISYHENRFTAEVFLICGQKTMDCDKKIY